ncbi:hypothetical protein [Xenorhabdus poinarii]|nr:hypothetical protein [Xenorhabdus poinarii]
MIKGGLNSEEIEIYKNEIIRLCHNESRIDDNIAYIEAQYCRKKAVFADVNKAHTGFVDDIDEK